jgi:hypothetical protein
VMIRNYNLVYGFCTHRSLANKQPTFFIKSGIINDVWMILNCMRLKFLYKVGLEGFHPWIYIFRKHTWYVKNTKLRCENMIFLCTMIKRVYFLYVVWNSCIGKHEDNLL